MKGGSVQKPVEPVPSEEMLRRLECLEAELAALHFSCDDASRAVGG